MRLLVLTVDVAYPPISGADLRNWQNAACASSLGSVHLVSLTGDASTTIAENLRMSGLGQTPEETYTRAIGATSIDITIGEPALQALDSLLSTDRPDVVIVEHLGLHPLLARLRESQARLVFDFHNIESDLAGQLRGWRGLFDIRRRRNARAIAAIEAHVAATADAVWVCSDLDADRMSARGSKRPIIVPNGLPRPDHSPKALFPESPAPGPQILFVGHLGYQPNVEAAERLARRIMPRLRRRLPLATLVLAGRAPHRHVRRLSNEAVRIIADPDDLGPILESSQISVVPLRRGGGTRLKIVEAMGWGVPVVATRLAAEGLDLQDGRDIDLAESVTEFVDKIASLWEDDGKRHARRACAHATAWGRFGPRAIEQAVVSALTSL